MRSYDVAIAALAIDAPQKWVDNILSHHRVPGVVAARRGITRRIPHATLLQLALTRHLHTEIALGVRDALRLAGALLADDDPVHASAHVSISVDRAAFTNALAARLRAAIESAPTPRRGRPPRRATSRG